MSSAGGQGSRAGDWSSGGRPTFSVVVPLYNEEANVGELHRRLSEVMRRIGEPYEILFVDDGSRDSTGRLIEGLRRGDPHLGVIHFSRNFGHQPAVTAGIDHAGGRAVVVMDGDLQDPPEEIPRFVERWREGFDVIYAIRQRRKEGLFKRSCYFMFYRILRLIGDLDIPLDSGDFCLMDRRVVEALRDLPERRRFVRGLRSYVGFRQTGLPYERSAREAGDPKYSLRALMGLAVDGVISFSSYPLRLATYLGMTAAVTAVGLMIWAFHDALTHQTAPRGWASTMVVVLFMGAVQLICLGIIGEYIRLIFLEAKRRPTYIVLEYKGPGSGSGTEGEGSGRGGRAEGSAGKVSVSELDDVAR